MEKLLAFYNNNQAEIARQYKCSPAFVNLCVHKKRHFGIQRTKEAEKITGIPRSEINPFIFGN